MRLSRYILFTIKEDPADAEIFSHKLMIRAGLIRKVASGLYNWLPTGFRVLNKIKKIVRQEMNRIGAIEFSMPIVQPIKLWKKSGRLSEYGSELFSFYDRSKKMFILSPTNEELICNLISKYFFSYKQCPFILYQIQTKFRDELRPRFGVIRSREFIMKDAYSFHIDKVSLKKTYSKIFKTYGLIFDRIGLNYEVVKADSGIIGGYISHEFQALSNAEEDKIIDDKNKKYSNNIKILKKNCFNDHSFSKKRIKTINIGNISSIFGLVNNYNFSIKKIIKTIIVYGSKNSKSKFVALLIRADHELNKTKAGEHFLIKNPLTFATENEIKKEFLVSSFFVGPINLKIPIIVDQNVSKMSDFIIGSNFDKKYFLDVNWDRDLKLNYVWDLCNAVSGGFNKNRKRAKINRGIEIGHIFQIGTKYCKLNRSNFFNTRKILNMGCYGIGISRLVAAVIEQNYDSNGIIWPQSISPFEVAILPINMHKSNTIRSIAEKIYFDLKKNRIDVILDDRREHFGKMLCDIELIGIPHIIIIGNRYLCENKIEYRNRKKKNKIFFQSEDVVNFLKNFF